MPSEVSSGTDEAGPSFVLRWITPITVWMALLVITTAALWYFDAPIEHDHLIFLYFVPTALIAIRYGSVSAMLMVIASMFAAAYLFYAPRFSLAVHDPLDVLELVFFCLLALLASKVVSGFANDSDVEKRRSRSTGAPPRWPFSALWLGLPRPVRANRPDQNV